ncbi:Serine/threonine-protein kinase TAO1-A [Leucoagaricus sp. SymC.cos]|nr:Serine/threonine-protein kinase TAO1-A [Leucoagaricus sp. SymC.cos]
MVPYLPEVEENGPGDRDGLQVHENQAAEAYLSPTTELGDLYGRCRTLILEVVANTIQKKRCIELGEKDAQPMVDFLAKLLEDADPLSQHDRKHVLHLLSKLAKSAQVFPQCFELEGVQCDMTHPVTEGGFANIYVTDLEGERACIKAIRLHGGNNSGEMFRAQAGEIILWAHSIHQNILPFRGIYLSREKVPRVCMVSQWMVNGDLVQYLRNFPDTPRIPLLHDVISGLQYLHKFDIVHADLKAKNVLVSEAQRALLADFGISRVAMTVPTTTANFGVGTAHWMAPELFLEDTPTRTRESDIWAFGCVCYEVKKFLPLVKTCILHRLTEVLTGMMPFFQYGTVPQLILAFLKGGVIPLGPDQQSRRDEYSERVWSLAKSCWNYNPQERPTSDGLKNPITDLKFPDNRLQDLQPQKAKKADVIRIDYDSVLNSLQRIQQSPITV